jgi:hypothetical protein
VILAVALLVVTGTLDAATGGRRARGAAVGTEVLGTQVTRPAPPSTAPSSSTTSPTVPAPAPASTSVTADAPRPADAQATPSPATTTTASTPHATTMSCVVALAYLAAHQAPGFSDSCADGSAEGHLGYTCVNTPGRCDGTRFIRIACPAPFVYMNEAHNSWVLIGRRTGIDPYGSGTRAEQAACAAPSLTRVDDDGRRVRCPFVHRLGAQQDNEARGSSGRAVTGPTACARVR